MNECCEACDGNGKAKGKPAAIAKVLVGLKKKTDLNISLSPKIGLYVYGMQLG